MFKHTKMHTTDILTGKKKSTLSFNTNHQKNTQNNALIKDLRSNYDLYLLILPVIAFYALFCYKPMYGAIIAFKDFKPAIGIWESTWVGFKHFKRFFESIYFKRTLFNTLNISIISIIFGFPAPIILALLLNELRWKKYSSFVKTVAYFPHFISMVVICAMIKTFVNNTGLIGGLVNSFTGGKMSLINDPKYFVTILVASDIWQGVGWGSIIYMAALAGIDQQLYEAAKIDGAGKWKQLIYVTLPGIMPTIIILLILRLGNILSVGYEKILLLYNPMTYETADVILTYVYRVGILETSYSFSTAVNLFNSVVNFTFLMIVNYISKKVSSIGLV